jgi:hypothetical protein
MTSPNPMNRLQIFKQVLLVSFGISLALLTTSAIDNVFHWLPSPGSMTGWHLVWFIMQVGTIALGSIMLVNRDLPLSIRLNTAFGYFVVAWITLLSFALRVIEIAPDGFNLVLLGFAFVIGLTYWWLRRTRINTSEQMFP